MNYSHQKELIEEVVTDVQIDDGKDLIVFNDDFNTFDHVIHTLIKICKHTPEQAEQCTYLIHYRGKCVVKSGPYLDLKPMKEGITHAGIGAAIF